MPNSRTSKMRDEQNILAVIMAKDPNATMGKLNTKLKQTYKQSGLDGVHALLSQWLENVSVADPNQIERKFEKFGKQYPDRRYGK